MPQGPNNPALRRKSAATPRMARESTGVGSNPLPALFDLISPRGAGAPAASRRGSMGRYYSHTIAPGGSEVGSCCKGGARWASC